MKCYNCGQLLPDDSEFCQYCGKRLEKHVSIQENSVVENAEEVIVTDEVIETVKPVLHNLEDTTPEKPVKSIIKIQTEETAKKLKENKKVKIRFCKFCGGQIDSQTKKCTGCGKQYFKGIKFNKFLTAVLILVVALLVSIILNIVQFVKIDSLNGYKQYYMERGLHYQSEIADLRKEIKDKNNKLNFYEKYAVIVPDDGSKKYHIYGCDDLDTSSFWIYNYNAAEQEGYYACSKCNPGETELDRWKKKYGVGQ
ncbi:MAG: zinc ribbon domain-containing protein [Clostridia bacterium]|nr:zinc ribbon domain-containing protein [Clostridia bacterium]